MNNLFCNQTLIAIKPFLFRMVLMAIIHVIPCLSFAQNSQGDIGFQVYALQSAKVHDVEPVLRQVLSNLQPGPEIVTDAANNRFLVRGNSTAHQLVQKTLQAIDLPALQPPAKQPEPANASFSSYAYHGNDMDGMIEELKTLFPAASGVRIASDRRTSQILVLGPRKVQDEIARMLNPNTSHQSVNSVAQQNATQRAPSHRTTAQNTPQFPSQANGNPQNQNHHQVESRAIPFQQYANNGNAPTLTYRLQHLQWNDLYRELKTLWGANFVPQRSEHPETLSYQLKVKDKPTVSYFVHGSTHEIRVTGPRQLANASMQIFKAFDQPIKQGEQHKVVALKNSDLKQVSFAIDTFRKGAIPTDLASSPLGSLLKNHQSGVISQLFAQREPTGNPNDPQNGNQSNNDPNQPNNNLPNGNQPNNNQPNNNQPNVNQAPGSVPIDGGGLIGTVQVEQIDGLDAFVIRGNEKDVQRVLQIIDAIERLSAVTEPTIEIYPMKHVDSASLATLVRQLYDEILSSRQGRVSITPLIKPNALLLIGRTDSVQTVKELIERLDQPVGPATQFEVFRLKHSSAASVQATIQEFFAERTGLGTKVLVTGDFRTNSLIVQASTRDLAEVALMIKKLDTVENESVNELRVFKLRNSLAEDLAPLLQSSISAPSELPAQTGTTQGGGGGGGQGSANVQQQIALQRKSAVLQFITIDPQGQQKLKSGILTEVRITADARANALVVSAPKDSMPLVEALIRELDQIPAAQAQLKVFTIINGDAFNLVEMLESLFGGQTSGGQNANAQQGTGLIQGETSLIPLRFTVDPRTNSVIASGSSDDLNVVEAILLRLDESDVRQRQNHVYRLKNSPAIDVATAINEFLRSERQVQELSPGLISPFEQIEREVVVVPEAVSNSLIVSATPRYFEEIRKIVEDLDARPPMVMIQVLLAEVSLNNTDEFGVELGLQDSILFDRSLLGDLVTVTETIQQTGAGGAVTNITNQAILGATNTPGFNFNNNALGNSGSDRSFSRAGNVGSQALSNFSVGRTNGELGYGGLVLSASSDSVSVLIRALKEARKLKVLSRPQIMTLDNQPAFIQVGQRVPRITGTQTNEVGQTNTVTLENVGLILGVTPRISPDNLVVMELDAEKSDLGPEADGIPISINVNGDVIRSPIINTTTAQTTVSALNGQTIVLGGLITESKQEIHREVPLLGSLPVIKHLFRFDSVAKARTELLIIMTPHIVRNEFDAERLKRVEASRMSWCLADVNRIHGEAGLRTRGDYWADGEVPVVYPDANPTGEEFVPIPAEEIPVPPKMPEGNPAPMQGELQLEPVPSKLPPQPQSNNRSQLQPTVQPALQESQENGLRFKEITPTGYQYKSQYQNQYNHEYNNQPANVGAMNRNASNNGTVNQASHFNASQMNNTQNRYSNSPEYAPTHYQRAENNQYSNQYPAHSAQPIPPSQQQYQEQRQPQYQQQYQGVSPAYWQDPTHSK